jgi:diphthamide biosynthesis protein 2
LIVHFGRVCATPAQTKVIYVLEKLKIDLEGLRAGIGELEGERLVIGDSGLNYVLDSLWGEIEADIGLITFEDEELAELIPSVTSFESSGCILGRSTPKPIEEYKTIIYLSAELIDDNPTYKSLQVNYSVSHSLFNYTTSLSPSPPINKFLMCRYALIEKAKQSPIIGIIMGTLSVKHTNWMKTLLENLIHNAGKKSYQFLIGKLNEPKLRNFDKSIDMYVIISCRETSLYETKDFYIPIITPFELV